MAVDLDQMFRDQAEIQLLISRKTGDGLQPHERDILQRLDYVKEMTLAATDELHEALAETGWKSWSSSKHINRDAFVSELVDTLQFLMNLFSVVECDAAEVRDKLKSKHAINLVRITGEYDGVTTKCPKCKRALDDSAVTCTPELCSQEG